MRKSPALLPSNLQIRHRSKIIACRRVIPSQNALRMASTFDVRNNAQNKLKWNNVLRLECLAEGEETARGDKLILTQVQTRTP